MKEFYERERKNTPTERSPERKAELAKLALNRAAWLIQEDTHLASLFPAEHRDKRRGHNLGLNFSEGLPTEPLFKFVLPESQYQAIQKFMNSVGGLVHLQERLGTIEKLRQTYSNLAFFEKCRDLLTLFDPSDPSVEFETEHAIGIAIACYDYYFADNIQADHDYFAYLPDKANEYFRAAAYHQNHPYPVAEGLGQFSSQPPRSFVAFGTPAHIRAEVYKFGIGTYGKLTPDLGFLISAAPGPMPPISVPRQMLFASLLRCGVNPLYSRDLRSFHKNDIFVLPRRDQDNRGASQWVCRDEVDIGNRYRRCAAYWGRVLDRRDTTPVPALLFSSGTAANEAAMQAIAMKDAPLTYIHPYWYHENMTTPYRIFPVTEHITKARALFVNLEPVSYFHFEGSVISAESAIEQFLKNARRNPEVSYYLVLDVTVNPAYASSLRGVEMATRILIERLNRLL